MVLTFRRHPPEQPETRTLTPAVRFATALPAEPACFCERRHDCGEQVRTQHANENALDHGANDCRNGDADQGSPRLPDQGAPKSACAAVLARAALVAEGL